MKAFDIMLRFIVAPTRLASFEISFVNNNERISMFYITLSLARTQWKHFGSYDESPCSRHLSNQNMSSNRSLVYILWASN
jgi:hypothetical protein